MRSKQSDLDNLSAFKPMAATRKYAMAIEANVVNKNRNREVLISSKLCSQYLSSFTTRHFVLN